ncbi:MAG: alpha/beta hydrolase [Pirellulales bacterium]
MPFLLLYILLSLPGIVLLLCAGIWIAYLPAVVRVFSETPWLLSELNEPMEEGEECIFATRDGLLLSGTYMATTAPIRLGTVAFCHGVAGDRWMACPYIENLREEGFDVFTFDFSQHGESARIPDYQPMPWVTHYELADVQAVVDYLCSRDGADPRGIGLLGVSKGGAASLCAAARDSRVLAVVTDGAFPTEPMQVHYIRRYMEIYTPLAPILSKLPNFALAIPGKLAQWLIGWRRRCRFVNVERTAHRVLQPVLMIHGQRDHHIPLEVVHALRNRIAGPTKLWIVPRAKHNGAITVARSEYHRRIAQFFGRHLAPDEVDDEDRQLVPLGRA